MLFDFLTPQRRSKEFWSVVEAYLCTLSPNTARTYKTSINSLLEFLGFKWGSNLAYKALIDLPAPSVFSYFKSLKERAIGRFRGVSDSTARLRHEALRSFYTHLVGLKIISENPFDVKVNFRGDNQRRPTACLTDAEVQGLLTAPQGNEIEAVRDRAIFAVLLGGGLRRSELLNLRLGDVTYDGEVLVLRLSSTKSGEVQYQSLPDWAADTLQIYVTARRDSGAVDDEHVFCSHFNAHSKPLSEKTLWRIWKHYTEKLGVKAGPHAARATAITKLLELGLPLHEVKAFARHSTYRMVERYDKRVRTSQTLAQKKLRF